MFLFQIPWLLFKFGFRLVLVAVIALVAVSYSAEALDAADQYVTETKERIMALDQEQIAEIVKTNIAEPAFEFAKKELPIIGQQVKGLISKQLKNRKGFQEARSQSNSGYTF